MLGQPLPTEDQQKFSFKISDPEPEYTVRYEVGFVPPFDIKGLDKNTVYERLAVSDLDELAEEDLQYARKRMGKSINPENDILEEDIVRIASRELESETGDIKEGGLETTISVFMKNVSNEETKNQLLASKMGDTLRFHARTIENHEKEEMYRKYILGLDTDDQRTTGEWFEGTIVEVSRMEKAELNEDFFKEYFGVDKVHNREEAIDELKKGIAQFYEVRANALLMRSFQERLLADNPVELPEKFLKRWLLVSNEGKLSAEQIDQEYDDFANNLRWSLLRDRIKEMYDLEVTDDEVYDSFANRVRSYFQVDLPDHIIRSSVERLMKNEKDVEKTRRDIETDKIFEAVRAQVTVHDKPVKSKELQRIIDEITRETEEEENAETGPQEEAA
jgi:trigger factor